MHTYVLAACGVAHQALEEIEPKGDNILIQGTRYIHIGHVTMSCDLPFLLPSQGVVLWGYLQLAWPGLWELPECESSPPHVSVPCDAGTCACTM